MQYRICIYKVEKCPVPKLSWFYQKLISLKCHKKCQTVYPIILYQKYLCLSKNSLKFGNYIVEDDDGQKLYVPWKLFSKITVGYHSCWGMGGGEG